jgi:regulation of enolase protein 1 (concanavalin A-like superfamily)
VDWTPSPALQSSEQIRVRIERQNDVIKFFANDQPLTTFVVPPGQSTNQAGVALAAPSQHAQATFTALVVERLEKHTDTNR